MTPRFAQYYLPRFFVDHGHYSDNLAPDRGPQRRRSTRTVSSGVLFCRNALGFAFVGRTKLIRISPFRGVIDLHAAGAYRITLKVWLRYGYVTSIMYNTYFTSLRPKSCLTPFLTLTQLKTTDLT